MGELRCYHIEEADELSALVNLEVYVLDVLSVWLSMAISVKVISYLTLNDPTSHHN